MSAKIESIVYAKSFYKPGEPVKLMVNLSAEALAGPSAASQPATLIASFRFVNQEVGTRRQEITLAPGAQSVELSWQPPVLAPRGYGLDLRLEAAGGIPLASASSAFDVLERWTQVPRYGFLSDFFPGRTDAAATMASLTGYHVNGLQFYDWMYRHDQFLTDQEPYTDLFGRVLSLKTVDAMIDAAHQNNIAAMPYTAVYGASLDFFNAHPEWDMYNADGTPHVFIEGKMGYMDMRPDSGWTKHLLGQFSDILAKTAFDGIHLDQYGDPKVAFDAEGNLYNLAQPMADMINATHALVDKARPQGGTVVFNAVTNWPVETVAPANEDIVYIEVWSPYTDFTNLHQLITQAQDFGKNKPVVLAAYIDPALEANARLMDAIIFSSGGGHIALGEKDGYLAEAYFPKYKTLSPELSAVLKRYIEFSIRYEDVFGPAAQEVTTAWLNRITVQGTRSSPSMIYNMVYPLVRENGRFTAVNLVNMLGLSHGEWAKAVETPKSLGATGVEIRDVSRPVKQVYFASPDQPDLGLRPLAFTQQDNVLRLELPGLAYWDMIMIEWGN